MSQLHESERGEAANRGSAKDICGSGIFQIEELPAASGRGVTISAKERR